MIAAIYARKSNEALTNADVFAYREARLRAGKTVRDIVAGVKRERRVGGKPASINRGLTMVRAMLKQARPDFRFLPGAFLHENTTRVRWLRRVTRV